MKKTLKILGCTIAVAVGVVLILLLTVPLWLGPVVKPTAATVVPKMTGTSVHLGHLSLNPYIGRFELGDFVVGNPAGYSEPVAVSISNVVVDVAVSTLADKCVHIEEVVVEDLFLSYVKGGENGVDNLLQIQYNLAGGKEKYEANAAKAEERAKARELAEAEAQANAQPQAEPEAPEEEICFSIDHLLIRGIRIKFGLLTIPLPTLELHDLGNDGKGLTAIEFYEDVWEAILKAATSTGDGLKKLGGLLGDGAGKLGEGSGEAVKKVGKDAEKAVKAVKDLLKF